MYRRPAEVNRLAFLSFMLWYLIKVYHLCTYKAIADTKVVIEEGKWLGLSHCTQPQRQLSKFNS